ncbi:phosphate ABC transporter permease [Opitutaceae bacterium EW11]|nr:phosphate ABC transporter permease [Opitutaceae bacterium EW11]
MNPSPLPPLVIEAGRTERHYWADLWRYRELFAFLAWRDLLVRYKQTAIGVAWALLQPFLTMVVFTVFGAWLAVPTGGVPRPVFVFVALLPWQFFSASLSGASNSLVSNAHLISKVYFPRLIVPLSAVATSLVDFLISAVFLAVLMAVYGVAPGPAIVALPLFVLLAFCASLGAGLWLTALNVKYRDFRFVLPFIVQFGLYISPVAFTSDIVPERWRPLYSLNPLVGIIDGFRWSVLGQATGSLWQCVGTSAAIVTAVLFSGIWYFRRTEKTFADVI